MASRQFFGIKYPFTNNGQNNFFVDTNASEKDKIRSQILHVILTPKGQRIRNPEFGTDLIRFIFDQNDSDSWEAIKNEISTSVQKFVPNASLDDLKVVQEGDGQGAIYVRIDYSVRRGNYVEKDSIITQL